MKLPKWLGFLPDRSKNDKEYIVRYISPPTNGSVLMPYNTKIIPQKPIHEVIREARTSQGITQVFLAKKIGISVHYLRKIESGDNDPSLKVVKQLATALNTPLTFTITPE